MSTSTTVYILEPIEWISWIISGLFVMIINIVIIKKERKKRKSTPIQHLNKLLKILPLMCMISGALYGFSLFVTFFPGFCYLNTRVPTLMLNVQGVTMGFYQLTRIYYCFSQNQVYSTKGYSNCLFGAMGLYGIIYIICSNVYLWFLSSYPSVCGINQQNQFFIQLDISVFTTSTYVTVALLSGSISVSYFIWDLTTFFLYVCKVRSFKKYKSEQKIHNRIMSILMRIIILTSLYYVASVMFMIPQLFIVPESQQKNTIDYFVWISWAIGSAVLSITDSYSIFMMQEHNTKEYVSFLRVFHVCCCCCISRIKYEIQSFEEEENVEKTDKNENTSKYETLSTEPVKADAT